MIRIRHFLLSFLTSTFRSRLSLQLEIAALRDQLSAYRFTAQQIVEAFPLDTAPKYLLRDRDGRSSFRSFTDSIITIYPWLHEYSGRAGPYVVESCIRG